MQLGRLRSTRSLVGKLEQSQEGGDPGQMKRNSSLILNARETEPMFQCESEGMKKPISLFGGSQAGAYFGSQLKQKCSQTYWKL